MKGNDRQRQKDRVEEANYRLSSDERKVFNPRKVIKMPCLFDVLKIKQPAVAYQLGKMAGYF